MTIPTQPRERYIALALHPIMTPIRIRRALEAFVPFESIFEADSDLISQILQLDQQDAASIRDVWRFPDIMREVARVSQSAIALCDPDYPPLLREIGDPPLALFFEGDRSLLESPAIAIVGSRRASPYGLNAARSLAGELAGAGVTILSGLARGIDAAAHSAALDCGGKTLAILGTGIDVVYPRSNRALFSRIAAKGLLLTAFPHGTPPLPGNFPVRNRIIAGMSLGTVVVEASARSGSLITARLASEQGREVFAVPGSIFAAGSEGAHQLIQSGAKLCSSPADIYEELPGLQPFELASNGIRAVCSPALSARLQLALEQLSFDDGTHIEQLARSLGFTLGQASGVILELEGLGLVGAVPGGRYVRIAATDHFRRDRERSNDTRS